MDFTFPYSTCEKITKNGTQPVSASINIASIFVLLYFFFSSRSTTNRWVLFFFILFETIHTYSHLRHVPGNVQLYMIHLTGYCILFAVMKTLWIHTGRCMSTQQLLLWSSLLVVDAYLFFSGAPFLWFLTTSVILFSMLIIFYYPFLPPKARAVIPWILIVVVMVVLMDFAESRYCEKWMQKQILPYHAMVEFLGWIVFVLLGIFLQRL